MSCPDALLRPHRLFHNQMRLRRGARPDIGQADEMPAGAKDKDSRAVPGKRVASPVCDVSREIAAEREEAAAAGEFGIEAIGDAGDGAENAGAGAGHWLAE